MCLATTCQPTTSLVRTNDRISSRIFLGRWRPSWRFCMHDVDGGPVLLRNGINTKDDRWSEHGLGHLLHPSDPENEDRDWIAKSWLRMIRQALGLPIENLNFGNLPTVGRVPVIAVLPSCDRWQTSMKLRRRWVLRPPAAAWQIPLRHHFPEPRHRRCEGHGEPIRVAAGCQSVSEKDAWRTFWLH